MAAIGAAGGESLNRSLDLDRREWDRERERLLQSRGGINDISVNASVNFLKSTFFLSLLPLPSHLLSRDLDLDLLRRLSRDRDLDRDRLRLQCTHHFKLVRDPCDVKVRLRIGGLAHIKL